MVIIEPYDKGYEAARNRESQKSNPYDRHDYINWGDWNRGWNDADEDLEEQATAEIRRSSNKVI